MISIRFIKKAACTAIALSAFIVSGCDSIGSVFDGAKTASSSAVSGLQISEAVTSNSLCLSHDVLGSPDWIELYNPSDEPIRLEGYGLSDNLKEPHKWVFPDVTIPPHGYLVVYASKYSGSVELCAGFGLSKSGEIIYLTDPYYNVIQQLTVPELVTDMSYALTADGQYGYCSSPTPGAENGSDIFLSSSDAIGSIAGGSGLSITEVMPENSSTLAAFDGEYYPWAEIRNTSDSTVLLSDYYLSDSLIEPSRWHMPASTLAPGQHAIVFFSGDDSSENGELHASFRLGGSDSALILSNGAGDTISMITWNNPMPAGLSVIGQDQYTPYPTPGADNGAALFTSLDFTSMSDSDPVRINELLKFNQYSIRDGYADRSPWVELYNSSESEVSMAGYFLTDNIQDPFKWAFPDTAIPPGGYIVVFLSGQESLDSELHTQFSLARNERQLMLTDTSAMHQDIIELPPTIGKNVSMGRDGSGTMKYYSSPTPYAANTTHAFDDPSQAVITTDLSGVYISEVSSLKAAKSEGADWIEFHNASSSQVDLEGWRLSDSTNDLAKYTFPSFKIDSGEYAVLSLSSSVEAAAPFGISGSGETLVLSDSDGNIRDVFNTGALRAGITSGRLSGSESRVLFASPTKGKANSSTHYKSFVSEPVLSDITLYHNDAFSLTITCPTPGAAIYYTTDGSKPSAASTRYTGPVPISQNTPVKAIAISDGMLESEVVSATYLFEAPHTLPVVCLSIDQDAFQEVYSVEDRWKKVEREGYFEYYESGGLLCTRFPCGLRVNGASTLKYSQKSLSIFLRGGYGQSSTSYQFFPGNDVTEYRSLSIRNSGQDWERARIRDSFFMLATEGLNIDNICTRPVVVYINGQYWGLYDLNENQNEEYLHTHFGVDADTVNIIRRNETPLAGTRTDFYRVRDFALTQDTSKDQTYQQLTQWVDVDYFTDYLIAQTYFSNGDMFNQKYWRTTDYAIKWRPIYYDLDLSFSSSSPTRNILPNYFKPEGVPSQDGSITNMDIFVGLRRNKGWCEQFGERYVYVVYNYFTPERLTAILDKQAALMEPEMSRHIDKWSAPNSINIWKKQLASLRSCLEQRPEHALKFLQREFAFSDAQMKEWTEKAMASQQQNKIEPDVQ